MSVPPFRKDDGEAHFSKARAGDPSRVLQVNHPRLAGGVGYFDITGLDAKTGRAGHDFRDDFDSLEVYNGFEASNRAQVDAVFFGLDSLALAGPQNTWRPAILTAIAFSTSGRVTREPT